MEQNLLVDNWVRCYYHKNQESEDDDEALSLCDLAENDHDHNESRPNHFQEHEEHFDFGNRNLPKNKMCTADELFFQGQIMPVIVSGSKSEPVSVGSSRSSSTRSHNSATSGSSSSSILSGPEFTGYKRTTQKNQTQNRNQFHSHPSPTPQIRTRSLNHHNSKSSSKFSKWRYLQLGSVKAQEIGLADLKNRSQRSQGSSNKSMKNDQNQNLLFGGCKCTANVVESTVASSSLMVKRERMSNLKKSNVN